MYDVPVYTFQPSACCPSWVARTTVSTGWLHVPPHSSTPSDPTDQRTRYVRIRTHIHTDTCNHTYTCMHTLALANANNRILGPPSSCHFNGIINTPMHIVPNRTTVLNSRQDTLYIRVHVLKWYHPERQASRGLGQLWSTVRVNLAIVLCCMHSWCIGCPLCCGLHIRMYLGTGLPHVLANWWQWSWPTLTHVPFMTSLWQSGPRRWPRGTHCPMLASRSSHQKRYVHTHILMYKSTYVCKLVFCLVDCCHIRYTLPSYGVTCKPSWLTVLCWWPLCGVLCVDTYKQMYLSGYFVWLIVV